MAGALDAFSVMTVDHEPPEDGTRTAGAGRSSAIPFTRKQKRSGSVGARRLGVSGSCCGKVPDRHLPVCGAAFQLETPRGSG